MSDVLPTDKLLNIRAQSSASSREAADNRSTADAEQLPHPSPVLSAAGRSPETGPVERPARAIDYRHIFNPSLLLAPGNRDRTQSSRDDTSPELYREFSRSKRHRRRSSGEAGMQYGYTDGHFSLGASAIDSGRRPPRETSILTKSTLGASTAPRLQSLNRQGATRMRPKAAYIGTAVTNYPGGYWYEASIDVGETAPRLASATSTSTGLVTSRSPREGESDSIGSSAASSAPVQGTAVGESVLGAAPGRGKQGPFAAGDLSQGSGLLSPSSNDASGHAVGGNDPPVAEFKVMSKEVYEAKRAELLRPWQVLPGLLLGSKRYATDTAVLSRLGVTHVLCVASSMQILSDAHVSQAMDDDACADEEIGSMEIQAYWGNAAVQVQRHHSPLSDSGHSSLLCLGACMSMLGRDRWDKLVGPLNGSHQDEDRAKWRIAAVGHGGDEEESHRDWADAIKIRHASSGSYSGGRDYRAAVPWPESIVFLSPGLRGCVLFLAAALGELGDIGKGSPAVYQCIREAQREAGIDPRALAGAGSGGGRFPASAGTATASSGWSAGRGEHIEHPSGRKALVHCRLGVSRSVSAIVAFLVALRGMSLQAAWRAIRTARPEANPHPCYARQLEVLDCCVHGTAAPSIPLRRVLLEESHPERERDGGASITGDRGSERSAAAASSSSRLYHYQQQQHQLYQRQYGTGGSGRHGRAGESSLARRQKGGGLRAARSRAKEMQQHTSDAAVDSPYAHSSHGYGGPGTTSSSDGVDSGFASTGGSQYAGGGGISMAALNGSIVGDPSSSASRWGGSASAGSPYGGPPGDEMAVGPGSLGTRRGPYRGKAGRARGGRRGGGRGSGGRSGSGSAPSAVPDSWGEMQPYDGSNHAYDGMTPHGSPVARIRTETVSSSAGLSRAGEQRQGHDQSQYGSGRSQGGRVSVGSSSRHGHAGSPDGHASASHGHGIDPELDREWDTTGSNHLSEAGGSDRLGSDHPGDEYTASIHTRGRSSTAVSISSDSAAGRSLISGLLPPGLAGGSDSTAGVGQGPAGAIGLGSGSAPSSRRKSERLSFGGRSSFGGSMIGVPEQRSLEHEFARERTFRDGGCDESGGDLTGITEGMVLEEEEVEWDGGDEGVTSGDGEGEGGGGDGGGGGYGDHGDGVQPEMQDSDL